VESDQTWAATRADLIAILAGFAWRKRRYGDILAGIQTELRHSPRLYPELAPQIHRISAERAELIARCIEIEKFLRQMMPFT